MFIEKERHLIETWREVSASFVVSVKSELVLEYIRLSIKEDGLNPAYSVLSDFICSAFMDKASIFFGVAYTVWMLPCSLVRSTTGEVAGEHP